MFNFLIKDLLVLYYISRERFIRNNILKYLQYVSQVT